MIKYYLSQVKEHTNFANRIIKTNLCNEKQIILFIWSSIYALLN